MRVLGDSCHELRVLSLAECKQLSDEGVLEVAKNCPTLEALKHKLHATRAITSACGTTRRVSGATPLGFRRGLEMYMDSTNEIVGGCHWPLVKVDVNQVRSLRLPDLASPLVSTTSLVCLCAKRFLPWRLSGIASDHSPTAGMPGTWRPAARPRATLARQRAKQIVRPRLPRLLCQRCGWEQRW